jgi:hypothetical protein
VITAAFSFLRLSNDHPCIRRYGPKGLVISDHPRRFRARHWAMFRMRQADDMCAPMRRVWRLARIDSSGRVVGPNACLEASSNDGYVRPALAVAHEVGRVIASHTGSRL